jgi:phosphohistidine phosphatase
MRHGEAEGDAVDHERALTARGRQQCVAAAEALAAAGFRPDAVLCSSAERAHRSAELAAEALGFSGPLEVREALYLAEPPTYVAALRGLPDTVRSVLLVAHNPGLSVLASGLHRAHVALPTGGQARFDIDLDSWGDLGRSLSPR